VTAYLLGSQNRDGGFGGAAGGSSSELYTAWAAIGLAAAGHPPSSVRHAAHSVSDYLLATAAGASATGDLERTILALSAARVSARHAAGRDLVSALVRRRSADGSFSEQANLTAFAILALRAAGRPARDAAVRGAARWLAGQANRDGGFGFGARGGTSDNDDSAAAVQALVVAGHRTGPVRAALRFIAAHENRDGGFPLTPGESSNAQSTAWAAQALVATGGDPGRARAGFSRSPLGYLRSLVAADGSVRYSRTSRQTPVWVSAQALTALTRTALPVVAPRGKRPSRRRVTGARARPAPGGTAARPSRRPGVGAHRRATGPAVGHPRRLGAMLREAGALAGLVLAPVLGGAEGGDGARSASAHPAKR
jgi:energy-coupling factor transport system substrate-specific component